MILLYRLGWTYVVRTVNGTYREHLMSQIIKFGSSISKNPNRRCEAALWQYRFTRDSFPHCPDFMFSECAKNKNQQMRYIPKIVINWTSGFYFLDLLSQYIFCSSNTIRFLVWPCSSKSLPHLRRCLGPGQDIWRAEGEVLWRHPLGFHSQPRYCWWFWNPAG